MVSGIKCAVKVPGMAQQTIATQRQLKTAQPMLPVLLEIKTQVEELTKDFYQGVLLNYYPDGLAGIGWHADDERDESSQCSDRICKFWCNSSI